MKKNVASQKVQFSLFKSGARIANPTMASGDFTVSIDGGAQANVATLPTSDGAGSVIWLPTQAETNGDVVTFLANDVAGAEWEPLTLVFDTEMPTTVAGLAAQFAAIPAAVWAYATRTLTSISALLDDISADVWGHNTRTLTQSAADVADAITGSNISKLRGDYWSISLTSLGSLAGRTKLYFTVKRDSGQDDADSLIQIEETAGLLYVIHVAATTAANGSLAVTDESAGAVTITLADDETVNLKPGVYYYDLQIIDADGAKTVSDGGQFTITSDVTRAIT